LRKRHHRSRSPPTPKQGGRNRQEQRSTEESSSEVKKLGHKRITDIDHSSDKTARITTSTADELGNRKKIMQGVRGAAGRGDLGSSGIYTKVKNLTH